MTINCPCFDAIYLFSWAHRPAVAEPVLTLHQAWKGPESNDGGTVRFAWYGRDLLVQAILPDQDIFNPATAFNEEAYLVGDVFEVFIKPVGQEAYYEFHVTPGNQQYQVRFPQDKAGVREGEVHAFTFMDLPIASGVAINRKNKQWTVCAQIPLGPLSEHEAVRVGSEWLVSFSRYDYTRTPTGLVIVSGERESVYFWRLGMHFFFGGSSSP
ncbi:MAG: hypothetical protein H2172_07280 [Opitutus sp.]|nr:hypothetical protein [Opitutus sp.]MCS6246614.1 hypothetical protein [Opitutus sp.]MCS6276086.1 hypothetical protein [Opitutus sp.]MCS6301180.1 hypothetical protein [Opitutus sp.]